MAKQKMKKRPPGADWCVTGINRLNGLREVISSPCKKETALELCKKQVRIAPGKRAYTYPKIGRVENYPPYFRELSFEF